ncbi:YitT family protein [Anaerosporobacter faecicola]|uniref:YitT family protein n=1 Tax=Anaerosporobacter faecicola TaxID=2718714 RepID=UPI001A9AD9BE|nr:YitT family protein [Anaerosporobacter faecicola]
MEKRKRDLVISYILAITGTALLTIGINVFIVPLGLYTGGFIGIGQILRTILVDYVGMNFGNFDIAGAFYYILNIPLFILAYRSLGKDFFIKTVVCVTFQSLFLVVITAPSKPIITDIIGACLIGGIIGGFGVGLTLRAGGSGGGQDILGVYMAKKYDDFSVGKLSIIVNIFVFGVCALLFDISIVIYSVIFMAVMSIVIDKSHYQNIKTTALIITKSSKIRTIITSEIVRGATCWKGEGAFTGEETNIIYTAVSKYEVSKLVKRVKEIDENAFIVIQEDLSIAGNFEKRL